MYILLVYEYVYACSLFLSVNRLRPRRIFVRVKGHTNRVQVANTNCRVGTTRYVTDNQINQFADCAVDSRCITSGFKLSVYVLIIAQWCLRDFYDAFLHLCSFNVIVFFFWCYFIANRYWIIKYLYGFDLPKILCILYGQHMTIWIKLRVLQQLMTLLLDLLK